jgi:4'-phosphopantetheinyl transferase
MEQPRAVVDALARTLDGREQAAATRRRDRARDRYVVAHGAMRALLGEVLDQSPSRITIDRRCAHCADPDHGKPVVVGAPSFSLSHSGTVGLLALSRPRVGIDVEIVRPRVHLDRLARRVFDETEYAQWAARPDVERLPAFLRAWTAKEAYLKAVGLGLKRPMRTVPVAREGWTVESFIPVPDAVASIAVEDGRTLDLEVATWTPGASVSLSA